MESGITKKHWRVWAWNKVQKIHYISGNFIRMNVLFTFDVEIWCNSWSTSGCRSGSSTAPASEWTDEARDALLENVTVKRQHLTPSTASMNDNYKIWSMCSEFISSATIDIFRADQAAKITPGISDIGNHPGNFMITNDMLERWHPVRARVAGCGR